MHASREKAASENMHLSAHFHRAFMVKVLCETVLRRDTSALQASILRAFLQGTCGFQHNALSESEGAGILISE